MECSREEYKKMQQDRYTPHVHALLIKAWADGAIIQYHITKWRDCLDNNPSWDQGTRYRLKPITISYRNFLWHPYLSPGRLTICVCSKQDNDNEPREQWAGFVRWIGDWQEVEV